MGDKTEITGMAGKVLAVFLKQGILGAIIIVLFLAVYFIYDHSVEAAENARKDVIGCYEKRAESTKQMVKENNDTQREVIKAINDLKTAIDMLALSVQHREGP